MSKVVKLIAAAAFAILAGGFANAHEFKVGDLELAHPWVRVPPKGASVAGGFMKITNTGKADDRLVAVKADIADKIELHTMVMENNVMKMRPLADGIPVPAGQTVELKPGGLHVMFIDIHPDAYKVGEMAKAELTFENAGKVEVEFKMEPMQTGMGKNMKMDHSKMDHGNAKTQ